MQIQINSLNKALADEALERVNVYSYAQDLSAKLHQHAHSIETLTKGFQQLKIEASSKSTFQHFEAKTEALQEQIKKIDPIIKQVDFKVERVDAKVEDHKKEVERVRVQERIEKEQQHKQIVEQQQ